MFLKRKRLSVELGEKTLFIWRAGGIMRKDDRIRGNIARGGMHPLFFGGGDTPLSLHCKIKIILKGGGGRRGILPFNFSDTKQL